MKPFLLPALLLCLLGAGHANAQSGILGKSWVLQRPSPTGENLRSIAHNGTVTTTTNGTTVSSSITAGTSYVAVGGSGTIVTAPAVSSSVAWSTNTVPSTAGDLWDVEFTGSGFGNKYLAVGSLGTILVATDTLSTTPTGLTWTAAAGSTPVTTDQYNAVSTSGGTWAVVGATSTGVGVLVISDNSGATWTRRVVTGSTSLKDVVVIPSTSPPTIEVVMDNALWATSNFGGSWSKTSLPNTTVKSIALASPPTQTTTTLNILGTTNWILNGSTLSANNNAPTGVTVTWSLDELVGITRTGQLWNSDTGAIWTTPSSTTNVSLNRAIKHADKSYVAVGDGGTILSYVEGDTWTALTTAGSTAYAANGVAWNERFDAGGNLMVAVGSGISWTSTDNGATWTEHLQSGLNMISVMWSGSYFVAVGNGLWVSADGVTWTSQASPPASGTAPSVYTVARLRGSSGSTPYALGYDPVKHVVMLSKGDTAGFGWSTFQAISGATTWAMLGITKKDDSSQYVAVGWGGRVLVTANPASTWTQYVVTLATGEDFTDVVWANEQYTAVTSKGGIWTSTNGSTWTKRFTASQALWCLTRVRHPNKVNDQFIAAGDHGVLATSYEGKIWTESSLDSSLFTNQVLWMPSGTTTATVAHPSSVLTTTTTSYSLDTMAHTLTTTVQVTTVTTPLTKISGVSTTLNGNDPLTFSSASTETKGTPITNVGAPTSTTAASTLTTPPATTVVPVTTRVEDPSPVTAPTTGVERLVTASGTGAFFASTGAAQAEPTITFASGASTILEAGGSTVIDVSLSAAVPAAVTLKLDFGTALASTYRSSATSITWPANSTSTQSFTLSAYNDTIDRNNAQVVISIKSANISGADVGVGAQPTHTVTITDNDHAPSLTATISSPLVYSGAAVTFNSVLAAGASGTPTYQWLKNGVAIAGATKSYYSIASASLASAGSYSLAGTNPAGRRVSNVVTLGVLDGAPQTVYRQDTVYPKLSLKTAGTGLTYQWSKQGFGVLTGAISATLQTTATTVAAAPADNVFFCEVTSGGATLTSGDITLANAGVITIAVDSTSKFVPVGAPLTLSANVTGPAGAVTWRWRKNGVVIPGAVQSFYQIPSATLASAGTYTVDGTSPAGAGTSPPVLIAVIDQSPQTVVAKAGVYPSLQCKVAGAVSTFQWSRAALGSIAGADGLLLPLTSTLVSATPANNVFTCAATFSSITLNSGPITFVVSDTAAKPVITDTNLVVGTIGKPYSDTPTATNSPTSWTITGLPPGLVYNATTGAISGEPRVAGTFKSVRFQAFNSGGASTVVLAPLTVAALDPGVAGTYMGLVDAEGAVNLGLGSRLDVTVTSAATFTGKLTESGATYPVTGSLVFSTPSYEATVLLPGDRQVAFSVNGSGGGDMSGNVTVGATSSPINGWRKTPAASLVGAYTVALKPSTASNGAGYGFIKIDAAGNLTMTGKLPDGFNLPLATTAITSAFIGPSGLCGVFMPIYNSKGSLQGRMNVTAIGSAPFEANSVAGTLNSGRIVSPATTATPVPYTVDGGHYFVPGVNEIVMGLASLTPLANAKLAFTGADLAGSTAFDGSFDIKKAAQISVVGANAAGTALTINAATGEFTGMFIRDGAASPVRSASVFGVLIRPGGSSTMVGKGFFFERAASPATTTVVGTADLTRL